MGSWSLKSIHHLRLAMTVLLVLPRQVLAHYFLTYHSITKISLKVPWIICSDQWSIFQVNDEKHRECKITSINVDKPDCKEFTTEFSEPITKGDIDRKYTLVYEVEEPERYFENAFLVDCQHYVMSSSETKILPANVWV